jgi:hypothetical protein
MHEERLKILRKPFANFRSLIYLAAQSQTSINAGSVMEAGT